jgi:hypothetical protein
MRYNSSPPNYYAHMVVTLNPRESFGRTVVEAIARIVYSLS